MGVQQLLQRQIELDSALREACSDEMAQLSANLGAIQSFLEKVLSLKIEERQLLAEKFSSQDSSAISLLFIKNHDALGLIAIERKELDALDMHWAKKKQLNASFSSKVLQCTDLAKQLAAESLKSKELERLGMQSSASHLEENCKELKVLLASIEEFDRSSLEALKAIKPKLSQLQLLFTVERKKAGSLKALSNPSVLLQIKDRISGQKPDLAQMSRDLAADISRELEERYQVLELYKKLLEIQNESKQITELDAVLSKKQQLEANLILWLNQLIIPRLELPSGNLVVSSCTAESAQDIFATSELALAKLVRNYSFQAASEKIALPGVKLNINSAAGLTGECGFISSIESFLAGQCYLARGLQSGEILAVGGGDISAAMARLGNDAKAFDGMLADIDLKYKQWLAEADSLNREFKVSWTRKAESIIKADFAKRWYKEVAQSYYLEKKLSFNISEFIVRSYWLRKQPGREMTEKDCKDSLEELSSMSISQFKDAVSSAKKSYLGMLQDIKSLQNAALHIPINDFIFIAPQSQVLPWEKYFASKEFRPSVFYYQASNLQEGLAESVQATATRTVPIVPKISRKFIRIYAYPGMLPLSR